MYAYIICKSYIHLRLHANAQSSCLVPTCLSCFCEAHQHSTLPLRPSSRALHVTHPKEPYQARIVIWLCFLLSFLPLFEAPPSCKGRSVYGDSNYSDGIGLLHNSGGKLNPILILHIKAQMRASSRPLQELILPSDSHGRVERFLCQTGTDLYLVFIFFFINLSPFEIPSRSKVTQSRSNAVPVDA